ncbi:MAG: hypothetical protein AB7D57_12350 [Desulfovibrionaceae bacterium]
MLDFDYLDRLEHFMDSGDMEFEFEYGEEEKRGAILDFLERLMDLAEKADAMATKLIFKQDYLNKALGVEEEADTESAPDPNGPKIDPAGVQ